VLVKFLRHKGESIQTQTNDVVGEGKELLRTTTMPLFFENVEFIHSPLMFLGLPYTLGFDPCGHFYHIAYKLCATYCIINTFQQTKNRRNSPS
jgi:hypothetical protein